MSEIEEADNNNYESEKFIIEDIEENYKSLMDSNEKVNKLNNSKNDKKEDNLNNNSNDMIQINNISQESKDYLIDSNIIENNIVINEYHSENEDNNNENEDNVNENEDNNSKNENEYNNSKNENEYNNNKNENEDNNIKIENEDNDNENNENKENSNENEGNDNDLEGPINLIEFNRSNFTLNQEALNILKSIEDDLIIVSIVGKARTGKSYLMNLLLNNNQTKYQGNGFEISSKLSSCTRGIWLWNTPRQKPNSSAKIIFIDSEGTNSVDLSTKTYDSKIFALIVLISSLFIYNTNGNIDEKSINELALASHLSNVVAVNAIEDKDLIINELAPKFIWVLRDFVLDKIDPKTGEEISSDEYLELCLRNKTSNKNKLESNLIRENIIKYFKFRECVTLPRPVDQEKDLHKLNKIPFSELKPNFREEFLNLKRKIYETSYVKKIGNKKVNGPILVELLTSFINSLNSKIIPNINTAIDNLIINEIEKSYENSMKLWKEKYCKLKEENPSNKDLFDVKYYIFNEYNKVLNENREIKYNNQYLEAFNNNKSKLENEMQNDLQKILTINNNKKISILKDILNKHKSINYLPNLDYNILEKKQKNSFLNSINNNYSNFINDIKNNYDKFDDEKAFDLILNKENEFNYNCTKDIVKVVNNDYENKINNIDNQIKENELYLKNYDINKIDSINEILNKRYVFLSSELDLKEKEIFELIGKYTKIVEKKDKITANNNNNHNRGEQNISTLRSQKLHNGECGITVETNEKGCGCQLENICSIF